VLRRQKRDDALARHVAPEIDHEVPQVIFLLRSDGAVGEEDERPLPRQFLHGVVRIDPRVHAFDRRELRARGAQLRRKHGPSGFERAQQIHFRWQTSYYTFP
jgi:hypothetical protein